MADQERPRTAGHLGSLSGHGHFSLRGTKRSFPLIGRKKDKSPVLARPSTSHQLTSSTTKGLRIELSLNFAAPLQSRHDFEFKASPSFQPSDQLCQALLQRLQHCSAELITRRDCSAMDPLQQTPQSISAKPMRYQINFRIERHDLRWADLTFTSFQGEAATESLERAVIREARLMVSLFLLRHDPGFRWTDDLQLDTRQPPSLTSRPSFGAPQSLCCVPRDRFDPGFVHAPGYVIELFLRTRSSDGKVQNSCFKIESLQTTPLTLLLGENLFSRASGILEAGLEARKLQFDEDHENCDDYEAYDGYEDSQSCQHYADGAFDALIKIRNTIGPDYNHLSRRIQSSRVIFDHTSHVDFPVFAADIRAQLEDARDFSDNKLFDLDDLTLKVRKIESRGREIRNPFSISLDSSITNYRRTTEAILDRVQAGINHVLAGSGASVKLTAHKRGHLVLDEVIGDKEHTRDGESDETWPELDSLIPRLRDRIRTDIIMICKDTCALESSDLLTNLTILDTKGTSLKRNRSYFDTRPSTPSQAPSQAPSTPTRQSISKKHGLLNLRAPSSSSSSPKPKASNADLIESHAYMAHMIHDDSYLSDASSTPSLVDTDSISPHDSLLVTPQSARISARSSAGYGVLFVDDSQQESQYGAHELMNHVEDIPLDHGDHSFATIGKGTSGDAAAIPEPVPLEARAATPTQQEAEDKTPTEDASYLSTTKAGMENVSSESQAGEAISELQSIEGAKPTQASQQLPTDPSQTLQENGGASTSGCSPEEIPSTTPLEDSYILVSRDVAELPDSHAATRPEPTKDTIDHFVPTSTISDLGMFENTTVGHVLEEKENMDGYFTDPSELEASSTPSGTGTRPVADRVSTGPLTTRPRSESLQPILAFHRQRDRSVVLRPKFPWARAHIPKHRRTFSSPTAGYLGLREERLFEVGLMTAIVPPYLRAMRKAGY